MKGTVLFDIFYIRNGEELLVVAYFKREHLWQGHDLASEKTHMDICNETGI